MNLIIVESPTKIKTIKRYLDKNYEVVASMGHLRDLPKSKFGVDIENNFQPTYVNMKDKDQLIKDIKKKADKCDHVYLAGDPDREGEAISWHLAQILELSLDDCNRVTFNELTKKGITEGMSKPRKIDLNLVNAQQSRRILDRIVGYKLSPLLWRKVRRGLSAGRVQSVAVRMIVDREREIKSFVSEEYWSIDAMLFAKSSNKPFSARLVSIDGQKQPLIKNKQEADAILARIDKKDFVVQNVKKSVHKKNPAAPFTTSTLQQEASRRMGFQTRRTMKIAQELYEGVEIKDMGQTGLITYMRTDSLRVSDEAREGAYAYIREKYGEEYIPPEVRKFKSKNNAQDAHEAIRPAHPEITPAIVKASGVTNDQYKMYKLIWERFIASQMANCLMNTVSVDIDVDGVGFKATGNSVKFDGFTKLYEETKDEEEKKNILPEIEKGEVLTQYSVVGNQHFTQPPARYSEATLVKALEEAGIGRPSTYVPTITTILSRNYVERDGKQLKPTPLGEVTDSVMKEHFPKIVDKGFTAGMETSLDKVERGEEDWVSMLDEFYKQFAEELETAEKVMEGKRVKIPDEPTDIICDKCGKPMVIKIGRFGRFIACSGFPECDNTKKIVLETKGKCPYCGKKVLEKKSKKGKKYYGCEDNPTCNFMTWDLPTEQTCPKCGSSLFKRGGKNGKLVCYKPECGYEKEITKDES